MRFRDQVRSQHNENKLFVMIVDECHVGITANQAHDMIVNDFSWACGDEAQRSKCDKAGVPHHSSGELLDQLNLVTILVSATPYNLLTSQSRLPHRYLAGDSHSGIQLACPGYELGHAYDVFEKDGTGAWYSKQQHGVRLTAQDVQSLHHTKVIRSCLTSLHQVLVVTLARFYVSHMSEA